MPPSRPRRKAPLLHDPEALVYARQTAGRTQAWLADQLAISPGHMSEIEKGTRGLTPEKLNLAADVLKCPTSVLRAKAPLPTSAGAR